MQREQHTTPATRCVRRRRVCARLRLRIVVGPRWAIAALHHHYCVVPEAIILRNALTALVASMPQGVLLNMRNVLILCTGNSARSVLAEALINHLGQGAWHAYSAGSKPTGRVNPYALATLAKHGISAPQVSSKSWNIFAAADAPKMDLVVTVCDSAANEVCPIWPGAPLQAHWGLPDPAAAEGEAALTAAFESAYQLIRRRVEAFVAIDCDAIPAAQFRAEVNKISTIV
jgi:arsenate reductase (thioredoxin)